MRAAWITGRGSRDENQDAAGFVKGEGSLAACVCDGLGGHRGGKLAAEEALRAALNTKGGMQERLLAANEAVVRRQAEHPSMRTTILLLLIQDGVATWAHSGDTRLYRVRGGELAQLTLDHSVPQALVRMGEIDPSQIRGHEDRARLTRALGSKECKWDIACDRVMAGDIYLLVTDGLWEPLSESDMLSCLGEDPLDTVQAMERLLGERADQDLDNYTALAVYL